MTRNFFKGSTDFGLMLLVNKVSQWLEKNVAESTGRNTLPESIPPHRFPVLASFLGCITVILKPDNPTFERMQKKEVKALISLPLLLKLFSGHFYRPVPRYQEWTITTAQQGCFLVTIASSWYQLQLSTGGSFEAQWYNV